MEPENNDQEYQALLKEIASVLNRHSQENRSNTPDFMLAEYLLGCLTVYENTISKREKWYGIPDPFSQNNKIGLKDSK